MCKVIEDMRREEREEGIQGGHENSGASYAPSRESGDRFPALCIITHRSCFSTPRAASFRIFCVAREIHAPTWLGFTP